MEEKTVCDLKATYDKYARVREKNEMQPWKVAPRKAFLEQLQKEQKVSLLEIGAGTGWDSKFFQDAGLEVTATDLSGEMVSLCGEKGVKAYQLDFFNLSTLQKTFDAVWSMNCLLHVDKKSLPEVLENIKGVLAPEGLFFMGVYGGKDQEGVWEDDVYDPPRFFSFYTDDGIKEVVAGHFDIVRFRRIETGGAYHFQSLVMRKP